MKNFKLRKDLSIDHMKHKLYRIECIKAIKSKGIKVGDLGGYVESRKNLQDNAWIYDDAKVFGNARVIDNAEISGKAEVYDNACVSNNAIICDSARIFNEAMVYGHARIGGNAMIYNGANIYDNVLVCDYAQVFDYARIFDQVRISEKAKLYGESCVWDSAEVYGNAEVFGHVYIYGNAKIAKDKLSKASHYLNIINMFGHNITITPKFMYIDCQVYSKKEWQKFTDEDVEKICGEDTLSWWKTWKPVLMSICDSVKVK